MPSSLGQGEWLFIALAALALTLLTSVVLLWMYRRALNAAMRARSDWQPSRTVPAAGHLVNASGSAAISLRIITVDEALAAGRSSTLDSAASARLRRSMLAYGLAGLAQAIVATCIELLFSRHAFEPFRFATLTWIYAWPVILTWNVLSGPDWGRRIRRSVWYFAGLALLSAAGFLHPDVAHRIGQGTLLWAMFALTPTLLLYPALARPIRAFGPVVLVVMTCAMFGSLAWGPSFWPVSLAGFLALGFCALPALWYFRLRYERKQTGDIVLTIDSIWLLFALFACEIQTDAQGLWRISPLLMFVVYKIIASLSLRSLHRDAAASPGRRLLVLRVFGFRGRTRRLMDLLGPRWRYVGGIQLIAGVDLAADYLGIPQFLDFIRGRLRNYFIFSEDDLERRVRCLDLKSDADGRFRVNMFFCFDDTWKMTADRLIRGSDAILMDLRGFTKAKRGCSEELHIIFSCASTQCVLLVVDSTTDLELIENAWATAINREGMRPVRILRAAGPVSTVSAAMALLDPGTEILSASSCA